MAELLERLGRQAISVEGLLDILLVWILVYGLLRLLRGRNAGYLRGLGLSLAVLGGAWLLTRPEHGPLPLPSFNWLLSQLAPILALVWVVVFQPEIRQAVGQFGQLSLFGRPVAASSRSVVVSQVAELAAALEALSARRIGALIAIERRDSLAEVVDTGCRLDAALSAELLETLFFPNTPLHDGAVVIRGERAAAAACLLPLSDRRDLASALGTRHRAALGLADRTDAVVAVVSEETGTVSVAHAGVLTRDLHGEDLRFRLLELLQPAGGLLAAASRAPQ